MTLRGVSVLVVWGFLALSCVGADAPRLATGAVRYRFAWPIGRVGTMTYTQTKRISGKVKSLSLRYEVTADRNATGGWTIGFGKPKIVKPPSGGSDAADELCCRIQPPITVDADGRFVETPLGTAEAALKAMSNVVGREIVAPEMRAKMISTIEARSRGFWGMLVGAFVGKKVDAGSTRPFRKKHSIVPGAPPIELAGTSETSKLRPCGSEPKGAQCVEATATSTFSAADVKKAAELVATKLSPDAAAATKQIDVESVNLRMVVVTEPATLLPRSLRNEASEVTKVDGAAVTSDDVELWEFSY